jgi:hypothetical protein
MCEFSREVVAELNRFNPIVVTDATARPPIFRFWEEIPALTGDDADKPPRLFGHFSNRFKLTI